MFKVGDRVRVISEIDSHFHTVNRHFNQSMRQYCGKVVTITRISNIKEYYDIGEDYGRWCWNELCFEKKKINEYSIKLI